MHDELNKLLLRYQNKLFIEDMFGNKIVLLFNETKEEITTFMKKFNRSKFVKLKEPEINRTEFPSEMINTFKKLNEISGKKIIPKAIVQKITHKFNALEFIDYGIKRKFDWVIFTKEEWEAAQPKKKSKFIKPKKR